MCHLQGAIHLVGRNVVEALALIAFGQTLPVGLCCLQERECSHHVGLCKGEWILDRAVYVAFCSQMDNAVYLIVVHQLEHQLEVADVALHKGVVGLVLDVLEVGQIACISQLVEVDDVILGIFVHEQTDNVGADKSGAACDDDISLHYIYYLKCYLRRFAMHCCNESIQ